jgi:hypothetical protein
LKTKESKEVQMRLQNVQVKNSKISKEIEKIAREQIVKKGQMKLSKVSENIKKDQIKEKRIIENKLIKDDQRKLKRIQKEPNGQIKLQFNFKNLLLDELVAEWISGRIDDSDW